MVVPILCDWGIEFDRGDRYNVYDGGRLALFDMGSFMPELDDFITFVCEGICTLNSPICISIPFQLSWTQFYGS